MSRRERVEGLMRSGFVCSLRDFYGVAHANDRNEIAGLRRRGWHFITVTARHGCRTADEPVHAHHVLVHGPERSCGKCAVGIPILRSLTTKTAHAVT